MSDYLRGGEPFDPGRYRPRVVVGGRRLKLRGVVVFGRRWFDRVDGNTYHSVKVETSPGGFVAAAPFAYGYDYQYEDTALDILVTVGILPVVEYASSGVGLGLRRTCDLLEVEYLNDVADVGRRSDLHYRGRGEWQS